MPNANLVTLGRRLPSQPSAVGNKSLMWPYHITRTPGCSTPKVDPLALPGVTTAVAPKAVPASTNEVFPASPTQNTGKTKVPETRRESISSRDDSVMSRLQLSLYSWTQHHRKFSKSRQTDVVTLALCKCCRDCSIQHSRRMFQSSPALEDNRVDSAIASNVFAEARHVIAWRNVEI